MLVRICIANDVLSPADPTFQLSPSRIVQLTLTISGYLCAKETNSSRGKEEWNCSSRTKLCSRSAASWLGQSNRFLTQSGSGLSFPADRAASQAPR